MQRVGKHGQFKREGTAEAIAFHRNACDLSLLVTTDASPIASADDRQPARSRTPVTGFGCVGRSNHIGGVVEGSEHETLALFVVVHIDVALRIRCHPEHCKSCSILSGAVVEDAGIQRMLMVEILQVDLEGRQHVLIQLFLLHVKGRFRVAAAVKFDNFVRLVHSQRQGDRHTNGNQQQERDRPLVTSQETANSCTTTGAVRRRLARAALSALLVGNLFFFLCMFGSGMDRSLVTERGNFCHVLLDGNLLGVRRCIRRSMRHSNLEKTQIGFLLYDFHLIAELGVQIGGSRR
mmetsp:Transcript_244/g.504  ORF Transcript_244/g.504 Transcript_244/m.504 type:complete len:292 (+) Transcript_244:932-1807(+)